MKYFKGYKVMSLVAIFFKFVEALFELALPLLMVFLIDQGIMKNQKDIIIRTVLLMVFLSVLGYLASITCQYYASLVSQKVGGRIRLSLFEKMMTFSSIEYDHFSSSTLTNRLTNDVNQIQEMIAKTIRLGVRAPLLMVGSLVALYQINPDLSIRLLWTFPLFIILVVGFMYASMTLHKIAQQKLDTLSMKAQEDLSGVRIIRAFSKTDFEFAVFKKLNQALAKAQKAVGYVTTISTPMTALVMNMVLVYLLYIGAFHINAGTMTQGQIVAVINYCTQLVMTLIVFMNLVMIFSRGATSWGRVKNIMSVETTQKYNGTNELEPGPLKIEFQHVSFSFKNQKRKVLEDLSFVVNPNEVLGIIGLTGSGKSSLVRLLLRLYDANEGVILINDMPIESYTLKSLREGMGYASQKGQFITGSLADNILLGREGHVIEALEQAQGQDILGKGLDVKIEAKAANLSGGQQQRVNVARSLLNNPGLLILDDSFSALDYLTDRKLRQAIVSNQKIGTQIYISTRVTSIMQADQIMVLHHGKIQNLGTHDELMKWNQIYREIYTLQTGQEDTNEILKEASI